MIQTTLNKVSVSTDVNPEMPILWLLRDVLGKTGTKYGCGIGACGACTVLIDDAPARACVTPVAAIAGRRVLTIEGVAATRWKALQAAWISHQVPQCGYCQSGMIMSAIALLEAAPRPTREAVRAGVPNLCRCGTYQRIEDAVLDAAAVLEKLK